MVIHSKHSTADQIKAFMNSWDNSCPVIIIPTTYYNTPTEEFDNLGVSAVIWANHIIRSAVKYMRVIASEIYTSQTINNIEEKISPLSEIFRLQNEAELRQAEEKYLNND